MNARAPWGLADLPPDCREATRLALGEQVRCEPLGGMSGARVLRLTAAAGSLVVKLDRDPFERRFYESIAPGLRAAGVALPTLVAAGGEAPHWILIEHVAPLPRGRWLADAGVLDVLRRLHAAPLDLAGGRRSPGARAPDARLLERVGEQFPPAVRAGFAKRVARVLAGAKLSDRTVPISGDANPRNWGVRGDGSPVLYDWKRFGLGPPELDLATTVPGLGSAADFERVAKMYAGVTAMTPARLAVAKLWTALELLGGEDEARGANETRRWLARELPAWLEAQEAFLLSRWPARDGVA